MTDKLDGAAPAAAPEKDAAPVSSEAQTQEAEATAIWNELDAADKAEGDEGKQEPESREDKPPAGQSGEDDDGKDRGQAAKDGEPVPDKAAAKVPAEDDVLKDAPEPVRRAFEAQTKELKDLRHYRNSQVGRQAALTRRIADLERQLKGQKPGAASAAPGTKTEEKGKEAGKKPARDPNLQKIADDYPEIAEPLISVIEESRATINELNEKIATLEGRESDKTIADNAIAQVNALDDAHPDWRELTGEPNGTFADEAVRKQAADKFYDWVVKQPQYVQEAARANGDYIADAAAAKHLIGLYKAHLREVEPPQPAHKPGDPKTPVASPNPGPSAKRQRQLESAAVPRTNQPGISPSGIPDDPEQAWRAFERMGL